MSTLFEVWNRAWVIEVYIDNQCKIIIIQFKFEIFKSKAASLGLHFISFLCTEPKILNYTLFVFNQILRHAQALADISIFLVPS